jgi:hypothetical protein
LQAPATDEFARHSASWSNDGVRERPLVLAFGYTHWGSVPRMIGGASFVVLTLTV